MKWLMCWLFHFGHKPFARRHLRVVSVRGHKVTDHVEEIRCLRCKTLCQ